MNQVICCGMFARYRYFCHRISLTECHLDAKKQLQIKAFRMAKKALGVVTILEIDPNPTSIHIWQTLFYVDVDLDFKFLYRRRHSYCIFDLRTGFNRNNFVARTPLGMAVSSKDIKNWKVSFSIST